MNYQDIKQLSIRKDGLEHAELGNTRKPKLTLRHLNKLRKIRELKNLENANQRQFLQLIYAPASPEQPGMGAF